MEAETVKQWLKETGISREKLAERLFVKKRTVDSWLSCNRPIPADKALLIEKMMEEYRSSAAQKQSDFNSWVKLSKPIITLEDIKAWLKKIGKSRQWLADRMKMAKGSIDNWLSGVDPIPQVKLAFIESLMKDSQPVQPPPSSQNTDELKVVSAIVSKDDYQRCLAASIKEGYATIEAWAAAVLTEAAYEKVPAAPQNEEEQSQVS